MAELLEDIEKWLRGFDSKGLKLAVGDGGLEIVVIDRRNQVLGFYEIGGVPMKRKPSTRTGHA